jgi:hypothetical protein
MPRPENVFIDALFFINAFLSLLPAVFIFIKKKYFKEVFAFLIILCLLSFIENVTLILIPRSQISDQNTLQNIFSLVEFMLLVRIFSTSLIGRHKELLMFFSIIVFAVVVTLFFSKGVSEKTTGIEITMEIIIIVIVGVVAFNLVERDDVMIFNYPLLWIAIGTLFYFVIALLVNTVSSGNGGEMDRIILLNIASFVRYVFYALAILNNKENDSAEDNFY